MARPKSLSKRTKRVPTMYAPEELVLLKLNARSARMRVADFTRFSTIGAKPEQVLPTEKDEAQIRAMANIQFIRKALEQLKQSVSDGALQEFTEAAKVAIENFNKVVK